MSYNRIQIMTHKKDDATNRRILCSLVALLFYWVEWRIIVSWNRFERSTRIHFCTSLTLKSKFRCLMYAVYNNRFVTLKEISKDFFCDWCAMANRKITQKTQSNDKFNMRTMLIPAGFFNTQIKFKTVIVSEFRLVGILITT
jgi:hypothetical protein